MIVGVLLGKMGGESNLTPIAGGSSPTATLIIEGPSPKAKVVASACACAQIAFVFFVPPLPCLYEGVNVCKWLFLLLFPPCFSAKKFPRLFHSVNLPFSTIF